VHGTCYGGLYIYRLLSVQWRLRIWGRGKRDGKEYSPGVVHISTDQCCAIGLKPEKGDDIHRNQFTKESTGVLRAVKRSIYHHGGAHQGK